MLYCNLWFKFHLFFGRRRSGFLIFNVSSQPLSRTRHARDTGSAAFCSAVHLAMACLFVCRRHISLS